MSEDDKLIISHYKTTGRSGKELIHEEVKSGSDTAAFLNRMELRRLATPCHIAIDMRGKVPGNVEVYKFSGITHYLDQKCIDIFETQAAKYENKYTVGVFESVMSADHTFRAQHELDNKQRLALKNLQEKKKIITKDPLFQSDKEKQAIAQQEAEAEQEEIEEKIHPIKLIPFGYRSQRKENRLNYASNVRVDLGNGHTVTGKTSDISVTGIKVSLFANIDKLIKGSTIYIIFEALEEQYTATFGKVEYLLIAQEFDHHGKIQLRLARKDSSENETFNKFLKEFIDNYQSRYKLELEDRLLSLNAQVYERYYNAAVSTRVCMLHMEEGRSKVLYMATRSSEHNPVKDHLLMKVSSALEHFINEHKLSEFREKPYLLLESFLIKENTGYKVYCEERAQLNKSGHFDKFLKMGSQSQCIARIQVTFVAVNTHDISECLNHLIPLNEVAPIKADGIKNTWNNITHIAYISVIEEKINSQSSLSSKSSEMTELADYIIDSPAIRLWQLAYRNERREHRYSYTSPAEIEIDGNKLHGNILDFSPSGIRVELSNVNQIPSSLEVNSSVHVNLPEMQKLAKKTANLNKLAYRVVKWHPHQKSISLKRDFSVKNHQGELFFTRLINSNKGALPQCSEDIELTQLSRMLEDLTSAYLPGIPVFIARFTGGRFAIAQAAATENANTLLWQFKHDNNFDFLPLNLEEFFAQIIRPNTNRKGQLSDLQSSRLFCQFVDPASDQEIKIKDELSLDDTRSVAKFILMTRKSPKFRILQIQFLPPPYIKLEEFSEQLKRVRENSRAKAKDFEKQINDLVAIADITDITAFYSN